MIGSSGDADFSFFTISRVDQASIAVANRVRQVMTPQTFPTVRILIANDHPDAADAMAAVLSRLGCPVRACYSGATALATAKRFEPEVCVLDSMLPGMEGARLVSSLRDQCDGLPLIVIATTSFDDWVFQSPAAMSSFQFLLVRPVDAGTLIETLVRLGQIVAPPDGNTITPTER